MSSLDRQQTELALDDNQTNGLHGDALRDILGQRRKQTWVADEAVTHCTRCQAEFTWYVRKHHCRACGEIFCHACCDNLDVLPRAVEQFPSRTFTSRSTASGASEADASNRTDSLANKNVSRDLAIVGATVGHYAKSTGKYLGKKTRHVADASYRYYVGDSAIDSPERSPAAEPSRARDTSTRKASPPKREKTCDSCHERLEFAHLIERHIPQLRACTVHELIDILHDKRQEPARSAAAGSLLRTWREIQYAMPFQTANSKEIAMLCRNYALVAQHSCWRVMLARSAFADDTDEQTRKAIVSALCQSTAPLCAESSCAQPSGEREHAVLADHRKECHRLLCRREACERGWSLDACITLLQDAQFDCPQIWRSCVGHLTRASQNTVDVSFFVVNLCWALRLEPQTRRVSIGNVLQHHCAKSKSFFAEVFWHCMSAVHDLSNDNTVRRCYIAVLRKIRKLDQQTFDELFAGKRILQALDASGKIQAVQDSDRCFPEFSSQNVFRLPINSQCTLSSLDLQQSHVMRSATRPMVVPCTSNDNPTRRFNVLLKREDIRVDTVIMNTIRYMRRLLESDFAKERLRNLDNDDKDTAIESADRVEASLSADGQRSDASLCSEEDREDGSDRFGIVCYRCVPTSNRSGVIEMVPESTTLDDVRNKYDMTLLEFIESRNPSVSRDKLRARFMRSTAASCVITYLLGVGDRHQENIMVTRDGHLFHIDFGYVMGETPKRAIIGPPSMRLTNDMVDALGGCESRLYMRFERLCTDVFNYLRRHYATIALLLMPLAQFGVCSLERLEREIQTRFVPAESKTQANVQLSNTINVSRGSTYAPSVVDIMHSGGKRASTLLTEPVMAVASLLPKSINRLLLAPPSSVSSSVQNMQNDTGRGDNLTYCTEDCRRDCDQDGCSHAARRRSATSGSASIDCTSLAGQSFNSRASCFRNSFDRETTILGRGVQVPMRSPLGIEVSPLQARFERDDASAPTTSDDEYDDDYDHGGGEEYEYDDIDHDNVFGVAEL